MDDAAESTAPESCPDVACMETISDHAESVTDGAEKMS